MDQVKYGDRLFEGQICSACKEIKQQATYKEVNSEFRMALHTAEKAWTICRCK